MVRRRAIRADLLKDTTPPDRIADGRFTNSQGALYVGVQLPRFALRGSERNGRIEGAAFLDASADGRQCFGASDSLRTLADAIDSYEEWREDDGDGDAVAAAT